jgi:formate C-acetyltransferase
MMQPEWGGFEPGIWTSEVSVREFIQKNYTPYEGDEGFLRGASDKTKALWGKVWGLMQEENEKTVLDAEVKVPSTITSHAPGYVDKDLEEIVGLQTDKPFKRGIMPNGGLRVVKKALQSYGYSLDKDTEKIYSAYRKTHNDGVALSATIAAGLSMAQNS